MCAPGAGWHGGAMRQSDIHRDPARIVIAGGGVAALETLIALRAMAPGDAEVTVVSASDTFSYRPLQVGEPFGLGSGQRYAIATICRDLGADFVHDRLVVRGCRRAHARRLPATGRSPTTSSCWRSAPTRSPLSSTASPSTARRFPRTSTRCCRRAASGLAEQLAIVVPDGASWSLPAYELALLTAAHSPRSKITLITYEHAPLEAFGALVSEAVTEILAASGVALRTGERAAIATPTALRLGWEWLEASRIVTPAVAHAARVSPACRAMSTASFRSTRSGVVDGACGHLRRRGRHDRPDQAGWTGGAAG